ncbi:MAG: monovalent cation/H+ antiporter subunit D family protein [Pseudomonadota bacterium]
MTLIDAPAATLMLAALLIPAAGALLIPLFHRAPNLREGVTIITAIALFAVVLSLLPTVLDGNRPGMGGFQVLEGLTIAFKIEPLGMLFALVASSLWIINSIYSIGYMRGNGEIRQTQFYVCFAVSIAATIALAFSANLFTLFIFYEVLTLSTYPLVTHKGSKEAKTGGRIYLMILLFTSIGLLLPALVATYAIAGTLDFRPEGILSGKIYGPPLYLLLALFAFGIGKAALMPIHFWLPSAMVAPTPVSALLHAVAVVKAGAFTMLKVVTYIFGLDFLTEADANTWLVYVASASLVLASVVAIAQDNLKARLAYSTVGQLAYIVLAAALATSTSIVGGGMHIVMHAAGKITLFFCAGAIYVAAHKTEISELDGIGRVMPVTMAAFLIGSLSIIGLPPFGGLWSKWLIGIGALDAGHQIAVVVLMLSSLFNVAYLLPIVIRGFMFAPPGTKPGETVAIKEAPLPCLIALSLTALSCIVLFFTAGPIETLLRMVFTGGGNG